MNLNYLGELYDFMVYSLIRKGGGSEIYEVYKTYGGGNLFPTSWKNLYNELVKYAKSYRDHTEYTEDLGHTSITNQIADIDFKNLTVHVRYPGSEDKVGVIMKEKSFYVFLSLCSILRLYFISGGSDRYTGNIKREDSELILSYIGFKDGNYFELKEAIGEMLVIGLGVADIEIILDLMDYLSENAHEDKEFPVPYPERKLISRPSPYHDDFDEEETCGIEIPEEDQEEEYNEDIIELAVNFNSSIPERFGQRFNESISIDDFPDLTDKVFIDKGVADNKDDELMFLKGDGKNIIVRLDYGLGDAVFKPHGTHENWGGFLYHCEDVSIDGDCGLFILIDRRMSEMWIGINELFFRNYPNYYLPEERKRHMYESEDEFEEEDLEEEDDYFDGDSDWYEYSDEDDEDGFIVGPSATRVDFILECDEYMFVDLPYETTSLVIHKNKRRVDLIPRSFRTEIEPYELYKFNKIKDIIMDIMSVSGMDISANNNFLYNGKEYDLLEVLRYKLKRYYYLVGNDDDGMNYLTIESDGSESKVSWKNSECWEEN
jgi:hypothetical protein